MHAAKFPCPNSFIHIRSISEPDGHIMDTRTNTFPPFIAFWYGYSEFHFIVSLGYHSVQSHVKYVVQQFFPSKFKVSTTLRFISQCHYTSVYNTSSYLFSNLK